jgi:phospholipid/cholesterol/gamma-HCH transport system substrate-binding protein
MAATAGLVVLSGCAFRGAESLPLPGGPDLGDHPFEIKVDFTNVLDLVPQSVVKVNDVSVGKITNIELDGWHARVTCRLRGDVQLPDNAVATVSQTSLLGEKFIALSSPTGEPVQGRLGAGDLIPLARTGQSTEIEQVLSALSLLINGGGVEQISTITNELNAAMNGRTSTIRDVLARVDVFVGTLDRNRSAITQALDSIDRLSGKLAAEKKTIGVAIDRAEPAIKILNRNRADLTKMLVSLDRLSRVMTQVVNQSKADLVANLKALEPTLKNLNKAGTDLPNGLGMLLTFPFPPSTINAVRGDYANINIKLDLDMKSLAQNLLGGTALDALMKRGEQLRSLIRPPSLTLPQPPPGVLGSTPGQPGGAQSSDSGLFGLLTGGLK